MSRRRRAIKRPVGRDPKYSSALVTRLVNTVMRSGEKSLAQQIVYGSFESISSKMNDVEPLEVFQRAIDNAKPRLEVKARRIGGATYQVPMEVPAERQMALALRWIVRIALGRKGMPMKEALANEIIEASQGQGNAIRRRDEVHRMAQANKAFAHFRW
ncbi:MAG: 30S ribosomal protein S7 [Verrucomicrobia bacterium]|nr:30S ribosomal protein S7 [Verrucomicrobiota bacterium]MCF7707812.1 30S ribosomal protein S7 [Verrucomicrobiota bacterium]